MPIDPDSGGTWIGANAAGLVMTLLNVYHADTNTSARSSGGRIRSRGEIIPLLLQHQTLDDATRAGLQLQMGEYPAFRLVMIDSHHLAELISDGSHIRVQSSHVIDRPLMFTSSGLGDAIVEGPRRELFNDMFANEGDLASVQDAYHTHTWPDRMHLSVQMTRAEARTVSRTTVELRDDTIQMSYVPIVAGNHPTKHDITLQRSRIAACR